MSKVYLLDCTLRDGGYGNNWEFGREVIPQIKNILEESKIDIIELGFFRNEPWNKDRTVFSCGADLSGLMAKKSGDVIYSAMIEGGDLDCLYNLDFVGSPEESRIDYIRVCVWKRLIKEHLDYCKDIVRRGYKVSIQPTAVEQYNDEEFINMLKLSNEVHPFAVYVVDTWGSRSITQVQHYCELAEKYLDKDIKIGYHGHNNKMQALSCSQAIMNMGLTHDICLDSTIMGMGRGIGNLQTEIIMDYMNEACGTNYNYICLIDAFTKYLRPFYDANPWGYSMYHFLSALYSCPQDFASYFKKNRIGEDKFRTFLQNITPEEKIYFRKEIVEKKLKELNL